MESIGAEVGQKMRSAIKAKLLELNCYVDDELPDYIMVMVANKRSKSQMSEDLNLFLSTKTSTFVDWLHIVLKKLREVTVTNPEVYKKVAKRKLTELPDVKVKKEKKELNKSRVASTTSSDGEQSKSLTDNLPVNASQLSGQRKITIVNEDKNTEGDFDDGFDIPLLSEVSMSSEKDLEEIERKIKSVKSRLGLLVESDIEEELPEIKTEKDKLAYNKAQIAKIRSSRTVQLQEESQEESPTEDYSLNKLSDTEYSKSDEVCNEAIDDDTNGERKHEHKRITFSPDREGAYPKRLSILDRLGKKQDSSSDSKTNSVKTRISLSEFRKEEEPFLQYSKENKERNRQTERDWRHRKDRRVERGKREKDSHRGSSRDRRRDGSRERRRDRSSESRSETWKEGILGRLGVMSKVSLPPREPEDLEPEDELKTREVRSMVQVKPRVIPSGTSQPNKNLLLKAVAEAQKSIAQTPNVGSHLMAELFTSRYTESGKEKVSEEVPFYRKFSQSEKTKLKNLILAQAAQRNKQSGADNSKMEEEYIPKPIKSIAKEAPNYVPSSRHTGEDSDTDEYGKHQFTMAADGEKSKATNNASKPSIKSRLDQKATKPSVKSRLDGRKSPSPIIFDKVTAKVNCKSNIPDKLPIVHPPFSIKTKERCKYWPSCRQGDKCEFVHPNANCELFPHCKFGEKCLFLHPICKFGSSCTKRDCPYGHATTKSLTSRLSTSGVLAKLAVSGLQNCKYFPNCTNVSCTYFHPKPCKFGRYCKNQLDCSFSHIFPTSKSSLIWRSK